MLNTRELASLILIGAFAVAMLALPAFRRTIMPYIGQLIVACTRYPLLLALLIVVGVSAASTALAWRIGLWNTSLLKDAVILTVTVVLPMTFRSYTFKSGRSLLEGVLAKTLGITTLIAFYLNSSPLPLVGELLLQPIVSFLVIIQACAGSKPDYAPAKRLADVLLLLVEISLIAWTTYSLSSSSTDWAGLWRSLLFNFWLPLTLVPFFYVFGFYMLLKQSVVRFRVQKRPLNLRVTLALIIGTRCRIGLLSRFSGRYNSLGDVTTFRGGLAKMRDFRNDVKRRDSEEWERLESLRRNSGLVGTDSDGAHLDRREFDITKTRLDWIWTCQNGRWEGNGGRYWDDLTDVIVDAAQHGRPSDHGFVVETLDQGRAWRAWRRTPGGAVLGVGGREHRSKYYYQGEQSPVGWPGSSAEWIDAAREQWPPDWDTNDGSRL